MIKRKIGVLGLLFTLLTVNVWAQGPVYLDESKQIEVRIKDALSRMTVEEKVALCHAQSKFSIPGVPRLGISELWMSDGPHGIHEEQLWNAWDAAKWTNSPPLLRWQQHGALRFQRNMVRQLVKKPAIEIKMFC